MEFDKLQFENLCKLQCSVKDIAKWFDYTEDELKQHVLDIYNKEFDVVYEKNAIAGKIMLRKAQFKLAEKNAGMAMWLGKQYLDQTDESKQQAEAQVTSLADIRKKLKMIE